MVERAQLRGPPTREAQRTLGSCVFVGGGCGEGGDAVVARCKGFGALWQSVVECEYAWGEGGAESRARGTQ